MFADCIRQSIHPAVWAVIGVKGEDIGYLHRPHGTAFAVDDGGHLLTAFHVLYMDRECTREWDHFVINQPEINPDRYLEAHVVAREKDSDLALLKITDPSDRQTTAVRFYTGDPVYFGTSCAAFGHALSVVEETGIRIFTRACAGVVSMQYDAALYSGAKAVSLYESDFFVHAGLSGGPVFLRDGAVFGVVSRSLPLGADEDTRSNLSIAIDIREVIEFLQSVDVQPKPRRHVWRDLVAKYFRHVLHSESSLSHLRSLLPPNPKSSHYMLTTQLELPLESAHLQLLPTTAAGQP